MGGQNVEVKRRRLRTKQKQEVHLTRYERFQDEGQRTQVVIFRLVAGVSNRQYGGTVEEFGSGYGISKLVISRKVIEATSEELRKISERDLSKLDLCALVIDGVRVNKRVFVVVLWVEASGKKHIPGMRQGATENSQVCTKLFEDLERQGLRRGRPILVVLDCSKALRSAMDPFFGGRAFVQRRQLHKRRNVLDHLPARYHGEFDRKMASAYSMKMYNDRQLVKRSNRVAKG